MKITLICVWFGKLPNWFDFFCHSCSTDNRFQWLVFTNSVTKQVQKGNVSLLPFTSNDLTKLVNEKMGIKYTLPNPAKLCDWKVVYGYLFEDYLNDSDWFGWCDIDVVYGDFKKYLPNKVLNYFDIITCSPNRTKAGGVFTILKNTKHNRELFFKHQNYINTLNNPSYQKYDHFIIRDIFVSLEDIGGKILWSHLPDSGEGEVKYGDKSMIMMNSRELGDKRYPHRALPAYWEKGKIIIEPDIESFIFHYKFKKLYNFDITQHGDKFIIA